MGKSIIRKTDRKCVLCKKWNGAIGSTTIKPKMGQQFEYDHDEKQCCFQNNAVTPAWHSCPKFEPRY